MKADTEKGPGLPLTACTRSGIVIDPATGCRIVSEWAHRRERSDAVIRAGHVCIGIVDTKGAEKDPQSLKHCLKSGKMKGFDKLADRTVVHMNFSNHK